MVCSISCMIFFHTQAADFRPHRHLLSQSYKCIKPQSSIQYLEHKREFGEPDLCLLSWTTILPWFTSESDDSNTKIGQLVCLERSFQKLWHLLDRQSSIDLRPSPMTSMWWLLCSLQTPFNVTGLPTVNAPPSTSLCKLRSGNYALSSLPSSCPYTRLFGFLHLLFCSITGYGILGWYL